MVRAIVPDRGDFVWVTLDPQAGHEQAGRRPALVISPRRFNEHVGLVFLCPITSHSKGYAFEVALPDGLPVQGVVLAHHMKSVDLHARRVRRIGVAPSTVTEHVLGKIAAVLWPSIPVRQ